METHEISWTRNEDKIFENSLVMFPDETVNRWQKIAERLPGKSLEEIRLHYDALVHDIQEIESGGIVLPDYSKLKVVDGVSYVKKGMPWSEEEHRAFLVGLETYGKGDWRSISRNSVITRSATQVASHAQKYFVRRLLLNKKRKRSSIHDITTTTISATTTSDTS